MRDVHTHRIQKCSDGSVLESLATLHTCLHSWRCFQGLPWGLLDRKLSGWLLSQWGWVGMGSALESCPGCRLWWTWPSFCSTHQAGSICWCQSRRMRTRPEHVHRIGSPKLECHRPKTPKLVKKDWLLVLDTWAIWGLFHSGCPFPNSHSDEPLEMISGCAGGGSWCGSGTWQQRRRWDV